MEKFLKDFFILDETLSENNLSEKVKTKIKEVIKEFGIADFIIVIPIDKKVFTNSERLANAYSKKGEKNENCWVWWKRLVWIRKY